MQKAIVILGPTTSGKSNLAVKLAKKFNGEIISADSRQVYRGLNIGSGKITKSEMQGVSHHLLDVANPKKRFTVVEYQKLSREKIAEIFSRGHLPIICGGTGFYINALLDQVVLPDAPPNEKLRKKLKNNSPEELLAMLKKLDLNRAENIDPKNSRRIIRAIEIATALGSVPTVKKNISSVEFIKIGISLPPDELRNRIDARLLSRIKSGMIEEVSNLHKRGLSWKRMEELGLEYRYLAKYLKKEMTESEMIEKLKTEIWRFSKRQMTWFKKDKQIIWLKRTVFQQICDVIKNFLTDKLAK